MVVAAALALTSTSGVSRAAAVVPLTGSAGPSEIGLEIAVARAAGTSTVWSRVTVRSAERVMLLVPAQPGAALDWTHDAWLDAVEDATAPRIAPPPEASLCAGTPTRPERAPPFFHRAKTNATPPLTVHATASALLDHASGAGFSISPDVAVRVEQLYATGRVLVSFESPSGTSTSPTLRVSGDGPATLPLALTGSPSTPTRVTAYVFGEGKARIEGAGELRLVAWSPHASNYAVERARSLIDDGGWITESVSNRVMFSEVHGSGTSIESLASGFFRRAHARGWKSCASAVHEAGTTADTAGRACAAGSAGHIAGGAPCTSSSAGVSPNMFACEALDDLSIAVSGAHLPSAAVTRFAGYLPAGAIGRDEVLGVGDVGEGPALVREADYVMCTPAREPATGGASGGRSPSAAEATVVVAPAPASYRSSSACGGGTSSVYVADYEDPVLDSPSDDSGWDDDDTTSSSSGGWDDDDTTSSSSGGWGDDSSSSGDDCEGDGSSSSSGGWDDDSSDSSDSCSSSSSADSCDADGDGWDSADMSAKGKSSKKPKRGGSPVSRYAMLLVALLLPLRRRLRSRTPSW